MNMHNILPFYAEFNTEKNFFTAFTMQQRRGLLYSEMFEPENVLLPQLCIVMLPLQAAPYHRTGSGGSHAGQWK